LRQPIARQQQKLKQAETAVAKLTDDYDELKQRHQTEIEALPQDNQSLVPLHSNLEKSQLLVRQLMQKHEAQLRDITHQNESRDRKYKLLQDREQTFNKLQAELDLERRKNRALSIGAAALAQPGSKDGISNNTSSYTPATPGRPGVHKAAIGGVVAAGIATLAGTAGIDERSRHDGDTADAAILPPLDNSVDVAHSEIDEPELVDPGPDDTDLVHSEADAETQESACVEAPLSASVEAATVEAHETARQQSWASATVPDAQPADLQPNEQPDLPPGRAVTRDDNSPLFDPVEQHDDLQQIFGIGPATEKKLNELGITSYSQLAKLNRHEIERISAVLQIVPGRIEKDDWIGKARQQLEEVLEEL
jgi:predicted flap endonuclease-1-like 5' DNA nuclease